jgi:hypothetical protein
MTEAYYGDYYSKPLLTSAPGSEGGDNPNDGMPLGSYMPHELEKLLGVATNG